MTAHPRLERFCANTLRGILLVTAFLPLFVFDPLLFPFVFPRTILFRALIELGIALYLILITLSPQYRFRRRNSLVWIVGGFVAVLAVTALTGANPYHSFWSTIERSEGVVTWIHLWLYLILVVGIMRTREDWREFLNAIVIAGALQTVYSLGQFFNLPFALISTGSRLSGSIGNPSFLAAYLLFIICFALWLGAETRSRLKYAYYALAVLDTFLLLSTQTRGAIIGVASALLFALGVVLWRRFKWKGLVVTGAVIILCGFGFMALRMNAGSTWVKRNPALDRIASISTTDITTQNRIIVWGAGLAGLAARPFSGWGPENFSVPFNENFNPAITRDIGSSPWYDRAHSVPVEIAVASGIPGLIMYATLIAYLVILILRAGRRNPTASLIFGGLLVAYVVQNLFVFDTINSYLLFLAVAAFIAALATEHDPVRAPVPLRIPLKLLVPVLLIALYISLYYVNVRPSLANYYAVAGAVNSKQNPDQALALFRHAFTYSPPAEEEYRFMLIQYTRDQIAGRNSDPSLKPLVEFTIDETRKTLNAAPHTIQLYLLLSELYLAAAQYNSGYLSLSEQTALEAKNQAPRRYQVYTTLGRIKMTQGLPLDGIEYFKQAISLNTSFAETYWNLGIAYILSRQHDLAKEALDRSLSLGFDIYDEKNIDRLMAAYRDSQDLTATIEYLKTLVSKFPDNELYRGVLKELSDLYKSALNAARNAR